MSQSQLVVVPKLEPDLLDSAWVLENVALGPLCPQHGTLTLFKAEGWCFEQHRRREGSSKRKVGISPQLRSQEMARALSMQNVLTRGEQEIQTGKSEMSEQTGGDMFGQCEAPVLPDCDGSQFPHLLFMLRQVTSEQ